LAPGETYYPWSNGYSPYGYNAYNPYGYTAYYPPTNPNYVTNYYTTYTYPQIVRIYRNVAVPGAVAMVPVTSFANGNFTKIVHVNIHNRVTVENFRNVVVIRRVVPVVPRTTALRFTRAPLAQAGIFRTATAFRRFPAMRQPPAFATQRTRVAAVVRKTAQASPALRRIAAAAPRPARFQRQHLTVAPARRSGRSALAGTTFHRPRQLAAPRYVQHRPRQLAAPRYAQHRRRQLAAPRYVQHRPSRLAGPRYARPRPQVGRAYRPARIAAPARIHAGAAPRAARAKAQPARPGRAHRSEGG
jgi:hypothetical protein